MDGQKPTIDNQTPHTSSAPSSASNIHPGSSPMPNEKKSGLKGLGARIADIYRAIPRLYLISGAALAMLLIVGLFTLLQNNPEPITAAVITEPTVQVEEIEEPVAEVYASPLTGVEVSKAKSERPITGIMIENSLAARPQSGLREAGVVFEAIAESGITRLLAIYQEGAPNYVGPVRSARPYYVDWLVPFDASYAHVGGDVAGKKEIAKYITKDLDQYFIGNSAYTRITSRVAPHNVYTDFSKLDAVNKARGYTNSKAKTWPRTEAKAVSPIAASKINMSVSSSSFNPVYNYSQASNTYKRTYSGTPHIDEKSNKQIAPTVVIGMQMSGSSYESGVDGGRYRYNHIGSGKAWIFQNGQVIEATWKKASPTEQITFTDKDGEPVVLAAGQTWLTAVKGVTWQ